MLFNPLYFACFTAFMTFKEFPLVDIPIKTSPSSPIPWTWRENIESKSVSFAQAVRKDESVVRAIDGMGLRSWELIPPISSVAKCWASAALPPFPHQRILPPFLMQFIIMTAAFSISDTQDSTISFFTSALVNICSLIVFFILIL